MCFSYQEVMTREGKTVCQEYSLNYFISKNYVSEHLKTGVRCECA